MRASQPRILVRAASGVRRGYGHAVRAIRLAEAIDVPTWISIDGPLPRLAPRARVTRLPGGVRALDRLRPSLLVLDTPVERDGRRWLQAARRRGIPVASIHDRGIAPLPSDLAVDGSLAARGPIPGAARTLVGPRFMVVDPRVLARRRTSNPMLVAVALGGGPRVRLAHTVATAIVRRVPKARVVIASGFAAAARPPDGRIEWLGPRDTLAGLLGSAGVAVVAGGVTLYEAAALGVPSVAIPIVPAQQPTVSAFARAQAALAPLRAGATDPESVASAVAGLLRDRRAAAALGRRASRLVDGRGATRVAAEIRALIGARR